MLGNTAPIYQEGAVNNITDFQKAIAAGEVIDNSADSVRSNLTAILGRTAAYEGRIVTWDEMMQKAERIDGRLEGLRT